MRANGAKSGVAQEDSSMRVGGTERPQLLAREVPGRHGDAPARRRGVEVRVLEETCESTESEQHTSGILFDTILCV